MARATARIEREPCQDEPAFRAANREKHLSADRSRRFSLLGAPPAVAGAGGTIHVASSVEFPASAGMTGLLIRLAPGASYPAHTHAGVEELHLLDGELWIDARKLVPGDYNYGAPGAGDDRVWSETGCTCVLVTSTKDPLR